MRIPITPAIAAVAAAALITAPVVVGLTSSSSPVAPTVVCQHTTGTAAPLTDAQAAAILQQVRELVTRLTSTIGAPRANGLGQQLRGMGITPAVTSGWRQQVTDLADGTLAASTSDPRAAQLGVVLAAAGFSPTPADLRTPPSSQPAPSVAAPSGSTLPAAPDQTGAAAATAAVHGINAAMSTTHAGSTLGAALRKVAEISRGFADTAAAAAGSSTTSPTTSTPDSTTPTDAGTQNPTTTPTSQTPAAPDPTPSAGPTAAASSATCRTTTVTDDAPAAAALPALPATRNSDSTPTSVPATPTTSATSPIGAVPSPDATTPSPPPSSPGQPAANTAAGSGTPSWESDAQSLLSTLQSTNDPSAAALAQKLTASGLLTTAEQTQPPTSSPAPTSTSTSAPTSTSPGSPTADGTDSGTSADNGNDNGGGGGGGSSDTPPSESAATSSAQPSASPPPTSSAQPGNSASGWEADAQALAQQLTQAGNDPTAQQLAASLAAVGITAGQQGGSGQAATTAPGSTAPSSSPTGSAPPTNGAAATGSGPGAASGSGAAAGGASGSGTGGAGGDSATSAPIQPSAAPSPRATTKSAAPPAPAATADNSVWDKLAQCESGGRWSTSSGNGYSGGLQFDAATWRAFGGTGYAPTAAQATKEQQIAVATKVRDARGGFSAWPACSQKLGL